ncbi:ATPase [Candidatus Falkowbacteria bacterium]|nr:ATPase [Bacteroidales bacterium]MDD2632436.1 potassium transporter TrkG [Bacteroidales bacterium]MDD4741319.1 potassium transporter TrkG [Bacteroidales bacterium]NCU37208.1 ATPase [Candidatus Falkowbacteria bacterium]
MNAFLRGLKYFPLAIILIAEIATVYDFGYEKPVSHQVALVWFYLMVLMVGAVSIAVRYLRKKWRPPRSVWIFDAILVVFCSVLVIDILEWSDLKLAQLPQWTYLAIMLLFIREVSTIRINYKKKYVNPAQLFVISFLLIITLGTIILTLPNATHSGISIIDALFTSTSAVCVTGLIVVDTGSYFTLFGQSVILLLIQLGGIGIMTFTSYFSYFFKGGATYQNQLMLKDMANADKLAEVFDTLRKIIILTLVIELAGAVFVFFSVSETQFESLSSRIYFSVFHAVSGFCNAGFSTLQNSLYETGFRFNFPLHLILAFLLIVGGLGFPILFNFYTYLRHLLLDRLLPKLRNQPPRHRPWIININTRIVIITTIILLALGTVSIFILEYNNTMAGYSLWGKLVTAFFGAATPRTAGFNTIDTGALHFSTILVVMFLMFVGASPSSTGGGIKTSTLALAFLNIYNLARDRSRIEIFRKQIAANSVHRAFAIITLSIINIGIAVFLITSFDPELEALSVVFETISAYGTVGLSLGITAALSSASKLVIIATMFVGRVSMLTIMVALLRRIKYLNYTYPTERILIN